MSEQHGGCAAQQECNMERAYQQSLRLECCRTITRNKNGWKLLKLLLAVVRCGYRIKPDYTQLRALLNFKRFKSCFPHQSLETNVSRLLSFPARKTQKDRPFVLGGAIAQVCYLNNIPFVIIRAIADQADDSGEISYELFMAEAAVRCAAIVRYMVTH